MYRVFLVIIALYASAMAQTTIQATNVIAQNLTAANSNGRVVVDGIKYPITAAGIQSAISDAVSSGKFEVELPCGVVNISATVNITNGPMNFSGCSGGDVTNSGSSASTMLKYTGAAGSDALNVDCSPSRCAGIRLSNLLIDGNGLARYALRQNSQDTTKLENVKVRGGVTALWYHVNSTGTTVVGGQITCPPSGAAGLVIDWGSSIFNAYGLSWDTAGCNASPSQLLWIGGGSIRSVNFFGGQLNINVATAVGFAKITGYDTTSPWPSAGSAIAGAPTNIYFYGIDWLYGANNPAAASQGADVLIDGTAANMPGNIVFFGGKFDARLASGGGAIAVKADHALGNIQLISLTSQGHTAGAACTLSITANVFSPGAFMFGVNSTNVSGTDTNRTCTFPSSILDVNNVLNGFKINGSIILNSGTALTGQTGSGQSIVTNTGPAISNAALTTPSIGGETITSSPRTAYTAFYSGTLSATGTFARIIPDKAITVTRVNATFFANGITCTVFPKIRVSDGASNVDTTATASAFADSGAVSQNYAAGANVDISLNAAQACTAGNFQNAMVEVQYKTQ